MPATSSGLLTDGARRWMIEFQIWLTPEVNASQVCAGGTLRVPMITDATTAAARTATITNKPDIRRTKGNLT